MARLRMTLRLVVVIAMVFQVSAAPAPSPDPAPLDDDRPEIIEIIAPAEVAQETLDSLNLGEPNSEQGERNKRTIGILREMFPSLSRIIDQKIQQIVSFLFRTVGRSLLSGAIGGGQRTSTSSTSSSSGGSSSSSKVSISLPTYGPDGDNDSDDDDDDDDDDDSSKLDQSSPSVSSRFNPDEDITTEAPTDNEVQASNLEDSERSSTGAANATTPSSQSSESELSESEPSEISKSETITTEAASSSAPTPDSELSSSTESFSSTDSSSSELADLIDPPTTLSSTSSSSASTESDSSVTSDGAPEADLTDSSPSTTTPATSGVNAEENLLSEAESQQSEVRVQFAEPEGEKTAENKDDLASDQESAASGVNGAAIDDLSLDDADADASDENRNKRFLNFGFGDSSSSGSGSGGGSGNFLFDIIRRPAESMARAAGQAFRILTGTDSIGLGITATHTAVRDLPNLNNATKLVAGSGGTEQTDEANSAAADGDSAKGDTYTEGIPGPVTRLFIIANRGISNLIQDLILRLAQTSERIVNFKARLITSII